MKKLEDDMLMWFVSQTGRSINQTKMLFDLVGDVDTLKKLEYNIKNGFVYYCPDSLEEVQAILDMKITRDKFQWSYED